MCASVVLSLLRALVGGRWTNALNCGLWCLTFNNTSSNYNINVGARLLMLKKQGFDVYVLHFFLLFALVGGYWYEHTRTGLWCFTLANVFDVLSTNVGARPLILKNRDLMCRLRCFLLFALVGGCYVDHLWCGLWYWNGNQPSSHAWTYGGARLLKTS